MVDSNLHREHILPSEKAFAYKMKMDALKHQGKRTDLTSGQVGPKLRTDEQMAEEADDSAVVSQILCKHHFRCKIEQNIFKAGAAEAVSALSTK